MAGSAEAKSPARAGGLLGRLGDFAAAAFGGGGAQAAPPSAEGLSPTAYRAEKDLDGKKQAAAVDESAEEGEEEEEEEEGEKAGAALPLKKEPGQQKKRSRATQRLRLGNAQLGSELDVCLAEWVRYHLPRAYTPAPP